MRQWAAFIAVATVLAVAFSLVGSRPSPGASGGTHALGAAEVAKERELRTLARDPSPTTGGIPGAGESRYMTSTRPDGAAVYGCRYGHRAARDRSVRDSLVVLDFGRPMKRHRTFGVSLFGRGFRSTVAVTRAAERYAWAYARCSAGAHAHVTVAIGTSNFGPQVSFGHGRAWAQTVNAAEAWARQAGVASTVSFAAGADIETGWNTPHRSRRWIEGYASAAEHPYYDFGDAGGCPPSGNCLGTWTVEDVWYVSWGAPGALPLPEIFNRTTAAQWGALSLYALRRHGQAITFAGVISQRTACVQSPDPCHGTNFTPRRAWTELTRRLDADPRLAKTIRWSTDVRWGG